MRIFVHGDSLITGGAELEGRESETVGAVTARLLKCEYVQCGVGGSSLNNRSREHNLLRTALTKVDPFYEQGDSLVLWTGWNDLRGQSANKVITNFQRYFTTRAFIGWPIFVLSVPPADHPLQDADYHEKKDEVNHWLGIQNLAKYVDLTRDPIIGNHADTSNKKIWTDRLHMTAVGYGLVAPHIAAAHS